MQISLFLIVSPSDPSVELPHLCVYLPACTSELQLELHFSFDSFHPGGLIVARHLQRWKPITEADVWYCVTIHKDCCYFEEILLFMFLSTLSCTKRREVCYWKVRSILVMNCGKWEATELFKSASFLSSHHHLNFFFHLKGNICPVDS